MAGREPGGSGEDESESVRVKIIKLADQLTQPGYYLWIVKPNGDESLDGPHDSPREVEKAAVLFKEISAIRPPEGSKWWMLWIGEVPAAKRAPKINKRAVETLNMMGAENQKRRRKDGGK